MKSWIVLAALALLLMDPILCSSLASRKGYSGVAGFIVGLLAPLIGIIYYAGLPVWDRQDNGGRGNNGSRISYTDTERRYAEARRNGNDEDIY